jgi:hypothetical protein
MSQKKHSNSQLQTLATKLAMKKSQNNARTATVTNKVRNPSVPRAIIAPKLKSSTTNNGGAAPSAASALRDVTSSYTTSSSSPRPGVIIPAEEFYKLADVQQQATSHVVLAGNNSNNARQHLMQKCSANLPTSNNKVSSLPSSPRHVASNANNSSQNPPQQPPRGRIPVVCAKVGLAGVRAKSSEEKFSFSRSDAVEVVSDVNGVANLRNAAGEENLILETNNGVVMHQQQQLVKDSTLQVNVILLFLRLFLLRFCFFVLFFFFSFQQLVSLLQQYETKNADTISRVTSLCLNAMAQFLNSITFPFLYPWLSSSCIIFDSHLSAD